MSTSLGYNHSFRVSSKSSLIPLKTIWHSDKEENVNPLSYNHSFRVPSKSSLILLKTIWHSNKEGNVNPSQL